MGRVLVTGGKLIASGGIVGIYSSYTNPSCEVTISGGMVVASGLSVDIDACFMISGGSVDARIFRRQLPTDVNEIPIYLTTVTVGESPVINTEVSCSVNGSAPFASITDEQGKLYLWMPEGQGKAEINVDGTIYRASGTVENNYRNVMLAKVDPVVTGVFVTPLYAKAVSGISVQFSARVEGQYNPPQSVTWAVENAHQGTIDGNGLLTISKNEYSRSLLVTATSTYDMDKSGTAQVNVISAIAILLIVVLPLLLLLLLIIFLEVGIPFQQRR